MRYAREGSSILKRTAVLAVCLVVLCCFAVVASESDAADGSGETLGADGIVVVSSETYTVSSNTTVSSVTVNGTLEIVDGATLTVNGDFTVAEGGTLDIAEGATVKVTSGTVTLSGAATIDGTLDASSEDTVVVATQSATIDATGSLAVYDLTLNGVIHHNIYNYGTVVIDSTASTCGFTCGSLTIHQAVDDAVLEIETIKIDCWNKCGGECFIITIADANDADNYLRLRVPNGITLNGLTVVGNEISGDVTVSGTVSSEAYNYDAAVYDTLDDGVKATFTVFGEWYISGTLSTDASTKVTIAQGATIDATGSLAAYNLTINGVVHHNVYNYGTVVIDSTDSTCGFTCGSLTIHQAVDDAVLEIETIKIDCWNKCGGECFIITIADANDADNYLRLRVPNGITLNGLTVVGNEISGDVTVSGTVSSEAYNYDADVYDSLDGGYKATFTVFGDWIVTGSFSVDGNVKVSIGTDAELTVAQGAEFEAGYVYLAGTLNENGTVTIGTVEEPSDSDDSTIWWIVAVVIVVVIIAAAVAYWYSRKKKAA